VQLRGRSSDAATFIQIFLRGDLDFDIEQPPRTIVDVGANIGLASIYLTRRFPSARIVAIEFESENYAALLANTGSHQNIECLHAGLWPSDGWVTVANPDAPKWAHVPNAAADGDRSSSSRVRAISMPTLLREARIEQVDLLKIDIEGSEYELFDGAPAWLDRVGLIAIELHDHLRPGAGARFLTATTGRIRRVRSQGEYLVCALQQPTAA
jgi:FkbM family methyltransferase